MRLQLRMATAVAVLTIVAAAHPIGQQAAAIPVARPIQPPERGLPAEADSANVTRFSFFAYGNTRGPADGRIVQPQHSDIVDAMLRAIPEETDAGFPVRFVVESGDAVSSGRDGRQWNASYSPIVERITRGAGLPFFFAVGNHDVGPRTAPNDQRYENVASANVRLWPHDGPRRLTSYPTFSFGYGQVFVLAFDSNIPDDAVQLRWVTDQLEHLDRSRFRIVVALFHHPPITSGSHGGPTSVESNSEGIRRNYLPLFRRHHVRLLIEGHDHLYDHYVEHYTDETGVHRMDQIVTGGGGGPIYLYRGEPNLARYEAEALPQHVTLTHASRPGRSAADNPHHFVIFEVDGDHLWEKRVATVAAPFMPLGRPRVELADGW